MSRTDHILCMCILLEKLDVIKLQFHRNPFWETLPPNGIAIGLISSRDYYTAEPR